MKTPTTASEKKTNKNNRFKYLTPGQHFFRKGEKIFLTPRGLKALGSIKISGTKIHSFFNLDEEKDKPKKTPWKLWQEDIFNCFPRRTEERDEHEDQENKNIETSIREYLEEKINKSWVSYPLGIHNVFDDELLGGVPDGEEFDSSGKKVISVLEIKTVFQNFPKKFSELKQKWWLQLAFYLYLHKIEEGYLCICLLKKSKRQEKPPIPNLKTPLKEVKENKTKFEGTFDPLIPNMKNCDWKIEIEKKWSNNHNNYFWFRKNRQKNELVLYKLRMDKEKFQITFDQIRDWFEKHKNQSPYMQEDELNSFLKWDKLH